MTVLALDVRLPLDRFVLRVDVATDASVIGLFGPSGSGKTSLLESIAGLRRGARGRIALGDHVWLDSDTGIHQPPEARHLGYVPQEGLLFPHLDVRGNLLAGARRARAAGRDPAAELARVAALLEIEPLLAQDVRSLSGGERQRVALGRALCSAPRLLLLDEPLAALDLPLRRRLLPVLRRVREELTVPMLLVSHDPTEVQALCDELIVLDQGTVRARGEPRNVLTDPTVFRTEFTGGPAAAAVDFENLLPGRLLRHEGGTSVVALGKGDDRATVHLRVFRPDQAEGAQVMIGLSPHEILLATECPRGLSARNILPATIHEIRAVDGRRLVLVRLDEGANAHTALPHLAVAVTDSVPDELGLRPDLSVHLVIKAASCRVYGG